DRARRVFVVSTSVPPAELIPHRVHTLAADRYRWHDQRDIDRLERQRFDHLADAKNAGPNPHETERHVGTEERRAGNIFVFGPTQHCGGIGRSPTEAATEWKHLVNVH